MEHSERSRRPRLKMIHVMVIVGGLAIVFGVLRAQPWESFVGLMGLCAVFALGFVVMILRPNPLKTVLANLPDDPAERISALEHGLARSNPFDAGTKLRARYALLRLYTVQSRYLDAIEQGRSILAMRSLSKA
jgi:hypothetical protein